MCSHPSISPRKQIGLSLFAYLAARYKRVSRPMDDKAVLLDEEQKRPTAVSDTPSEMGFPIPAAYVADSILGPSRLPNAIKKAHDYVTVTMRLTTSSKRIHYSPVT